MSSIPLEKRVDELEREIAAIKSRLDGAPKTRDTTESGWDRIWGSFANDPMFDEAMRLGREYRESLRPKPKSRKRRKK